MRPCDGWDGRSAQHRRSGADARGDRRWTGGCLLSGSSALPPWCGRSPWPPSPSPPPSCPASSRPGPRRTRGRPSSAGWCRPGRRRWPAEPEPPTGRSAGCRTPTGRGPRPHRRRRRHPRRQHGPGHGRHRRTTADTEDPLNRVLATPAGRPGPRRSGAARPRRPHQPGHDRPSRPGRRRPRRRDRAATGRPGRRPGRRLLVRSRATAPSRSASPPTTRDWVTPTAGCADPTAMWNEVAASVGFVAGARAGT